MAAPSVDLQHMITAHLRARGRSINYRQSAMRWFEYAVFVAVVGLVVIGVARWEGWNYSIIAGGVILVAGLVALMAALLLMRSIDEERLARRLHRQHLRHRAGEGTSERRRAI